MEQTINPVTRLEFYLAALSGMEIQPPSYVTRLEHYLQDIIDGNASDIVPVTRVEHYLAKISGADVEIPEPITRIEQYLAQIAGEDIETPDPITREEYLLREWAEGSGGGTYGPADIVSFETKKARKLKSLQVSLSPIQDLHGYDSPWPAGGGKNILQVTAAGTTTVNGITYTVYDDGTIKVAGTATSISTFNLNNIAEIQNNVSYKLWSGVTGDRFGTYALQMCNKANSATICTTVNGVTSFTLSDEIEAFARIVVWDGVTIDETFKPMITLASVTENTFAPYENLCPITGRTGAGAYLGAEHDPDTATLYSVEFPALGANQWDEQWELGTYDTTTGEKTASTTQIRSKNYIPVLPSESYRLVVPTGVYCRRFFYDAEKGFVSTFVTQGSDTITVPNGCYYMTFQLGSEYGTTYNSNIAVNYPSTVTTYEPYTNTVYSCTVDIVTGVLTVDMASLTKNTADMNNSDNYPGWKNSGCRSIIGANINGRVPGAFTNISPASLGGSGGVIANTLASNDILILNRGDFNKTQAEWIALAMDVQFMLPLAEPIHFTVDPQQIMSLAGQNVVWSPDGEVTVKT